MWTVDAETQALVHAACHLLHLDDGSGKPGMGAVDILTEILANM